MMSDIVHAHYPDIEDHLLDKAMGAFYQVRDLPTVAKKPSTSELIDWLKLLVAVPIDMDTFEEKGAPFITVDTVGAGEGEIVMWAGGSSSRQTDLTTNKPVDSSIVGIVDFVDILGKRVYDKGNAS